MADQRHRCLYAHWTVCIMLIEDSVQCDNTIIIIEFISDTSFLEENRFLIIPTPKWMRITSLIESQPQYVYAFYGNMDLTNSMKFFFLKKKPQKGKRRIIIFLFKVWHNIHFIFHWCIYIGVNMVMILLLTEYLIIQIFIFWRCTLRHHINIDINDPALELNRIIHSRFGFLFLTKTHTHMHARIYIYNLNCISYVEFLS